MTDQTAAQPTDAVQGWNSPQFRSKLASVVRHYGIDSLDRSGRPYRCPMMRCSAAVVEVPA